jgi:coproporphyrinogen III oxidase
MTMSRIPAQSGKAGQALALVDSLQQRFVEALEAWAGNPFAADEWLRDGGSHGGGIRYGIGGTERLGRASVNVSQVHYDDEPDKQLGSASALSAIVHPAHPCRPSVHIHISWTELKHEEGYWRIMADLNPAIPRAGQTERFADGLRNVAAAVYDEAAEQGDRYFYIPALERHRGAVHFYLEQYNSGSFEADYRLAGQVGQAAMEGYMRLLEEACPPAGPADAVAQLAYHTLYFFQVLTLDRGTTAGLLVHDQNDIGIMGSLPPRIDKVLLASWKSRMVTPQDRLLDGILSVLPPEEPCVIDDGIKQALAQVVREHYRRHPEALEHQASGLHIPPTMANHRKGETHGA